MNAKDAMITTAVQEASLRTRPTYAQARYRENKPICVDCFVPCDPRSRAYRALHKCEQCYDYTPVITIKKEVLHGHRRDANQ